MRARSPPHVRFCRQRLADRIASLRGKRKLPSEEGAPAAKRAKPDKKKEATAPAPRQERYGVGIRFILYLCSLLLDVNVRIHATVLCLWCINACVLSLWRMSGSQAGLYFSDLWLSLPACARFANLCLFSLLALRRRMSHEGKGSFGAGEGAGGDAPVVFSKFDFSAIEKQKKNKNKDYKSLLAKVRYRLLLVRSHYHGRVRIHAFEERLGWSPRAAACPVPCASTLDSIAARPPPLQKAIMPIRPCVL